MTLTLEITPEQERQLEAEAHRRNMDAADYAKAMLFDKEPQNSETQTEEESWSGADLVAYWKREGVIGSRPDITDSLKHAQALRRQAEQRIRE